MTFFTARQLEDLHKSTGGNGQVVLPYRARLTPLAWDWLRAKKVAVGYSDVDGKPQEKSEAAAGSGKSDDAAGAFVWWCEGPCGPAKAAIAMQSRETSMRPIDVGSDVKQLVPVIKKIAAEIKAGKAAGGVLMVTNAATAVVYANRCPSIRAILGTCLDAVDQGVKQIAANVLIVEHPYKTLQQVRNMLSRFVKGKRDLTEDVKRQIAELASCG